MLPPSEGGGGGAALSLMARQFSVARLELGEGLIGNPAALAVTGAFATGRNGSIDASIDAKRIDGGAGTLTARVERASGDARLMVDATLEEAPDGILLGLMGRDSGPGYRLTAKTGIDDGAFDGSVSLTSDGNARFAGQFTLTPAGDAGQRLTVTGEGDLAELVPPAFADFLSGEIRVAVDADWQQDPGQRLPRITIRDGRVATGSLRAEASGAFGGAATDLSFKMEAARPDGGGFVLPLGGGESLAFDSVDLSGRIAPSGGVTRLDLIGRAAELSVNGVATPAIGFSLAVEAEGDDPLADRTLPFAFRAEADSVEIAGRTVPGGAATPLVLSAQGTFDLDAMSAETTAALDVSGGKVTYAGTIAANGSVTGRAEAAFADIAPLAAIFGQPVSGGLSASAEGAFAGPDGLDLPRDRKHSPRFLVMQPKAAGPTCMHRLHGCGRVRGMSPRTPPHASRDRPRRARQLPRARQRRSDSASLHSPAASSPWSARSAAACSSARRPASSRPTAATSSSPGSARSQNSPTTWTGTW